MSVELSWENLEEVYMNSLDGSGVLYDKLCSDAKPSDFYFAVHNSFDTSENTDDLDISYIFLVPKAFFDKEKHMWDQHMCVDHILPKDFGEVMECVWDCERSLEDVRKDLLSRGFEENNKIIKR